MGAGGSCISMCSYYMRNSGKGNGREEYRCGKPFYAKAGRVPGGLTRTFLSEYCSPAEYFLTPDPGQNDDVMAKEMGERLSGQSMPPALEKTVRVLR